MEDNVAPDIGKEDRKSLRRRDWEITEDRLTARNTNEIIIHTIILGFALFGFITMLDLIFDWGRISLWALLAQFGSAFFLTLGARYGQQMRRDADEAERERHGFTLDDGRKATDGATKL